jgi:uncharacterized membrane protein
MEITGKVVQILPIEQGVSKATGAPWQKATVIVEYQDGTYLRKVALSNMKKATELSQLKLNGDYTFSVTPESRESNGRWFTSLNTWLWKEVAMQGAPPQQYAAPAQQPYQVPAQQQYAQPQQRYQAPPAAQDGSELPF